MKNRVSIILSLLCFFSLLVFSCQKEKEKPLEKEDRKESGKDIFREDFNASIDETIWQIGTWKEHGGQTSKERVYTKDGYLHLVFRNDNGSYLGSAIQTRKEFSYGKWEVRLKPTSVSGVLNSFYTIDWNDKGVGDGSKQEIDIEFLTYKFKENAGEVHLATHATDKKSFSTNVPLNFNPSDDFHIWGFNILPDRIEWFVDGKTYYTYYYKDHDVKITENYFLKLNSWTDTSWIKGPPKSGVDCIFLIDWIQFTPY